MKILSVTSEVFPLIKTGGLADVTGSLPKALEGYNCYTRTLVPGYPQLFSKLPDARQIYFFPDLFGAPASLLEARYEQLDLLILDAPSLYNRPGGPYLDETGHDHPDNWKRFAVLSYVASAIAGGLLANWSPDVVHTHDWQTALTLGLHALFQQCPEGSKRPDDPQPGIPGTVPDFGRQPDRPAAGSNLPRLPRILRRCQLSEGRHPYRQRHHDGEPHLCA